ncbi:hypothetical protein L1887_42762 [Cichorium endivia]|nr:hypothetical protein L1887_42762 [Cichorium endivia]
METSLEAAQTLIRGAVRHLNSGGELRIVANAFLAYPKVLDETFGFHEVIAQTGRFKVYRTVMTRQAKKMRLRGYDTFTVSMVCEGGGIGRRASFSITRIPLTSATHDGSKTKWRSCLCQIMPDVTNRPDTMSAFQIIICQLNESKSMDLYLSRNDRNCLRKYQLSLRLFLFLNATSAVFSVTNPLNSVRLLSAPLIAIFSISTGLFVWHWRKRARKINIPVVSGIFGILWAWQIESKFALITHDHATYLLIALLTVLFIGTLAFASNIKAFTLHSLPTFIVCLWLSDHDIWLRMSYSFALPVVAIAIHNILQTRNDRFAQELLSRLLEERETLTDLSMMDPLTGLYNRRGLQSRLENLPTVEKWRAFCSADGYRPL